MMSTVGPSKDARRGSRFSQLEATQASQSFVATANLLKATSSKRALATARHTKIRARFGLQDIAPIVEEHDAHPHHDLWWSRVRLVLREPFAEFWGVFIMILFGDGSVAQVLLSERTSGAPGSDGWGGYQSISWGWGIGIMLGIYVAGESGAFLNPAVTFACCVYRGLPWRRLPIYMLAQVSGAFLASGVVYANYIKAIDAYAGEGVRTVPPAAGSTAQIFCTYPQAFLHKSNQFVSELIASAILMFCIFALKDDSNRGIASGSTNWFPLGLFFLIFGLGACFGFETGYALNLARDFGPRLMSYVVGYGSGVWSAGDYYFWVPMVAPFIGCLLGGFLYDMFIYTGPETPINSPWFGIPHLLRPDKALKERWSERMVGVKHISDNSTEDVENFVPE